MTVQELINELQMFPADMQVFLNENRHVDPLDSPVKEMEIAYPNQKPFTVALVG